MRSRLLVESVLLFTVFHCLPANADCKGSGILDLSHYDGTLGDSA